MVVFGRNAQKDGWRVSGIDGENAVDFTLGITKMNLIRSFAFFAALWPLATAYGAGAELRTPTYIVQITENCEEGEVGCRDVTYVGTNAKTAKPITLKGTAIMHMCPDRVTPCSHEGYEFRNGKVTYRVTPDGALVVSRGSKVLIEEHGTWQR